MARETPTWSRATDRMRRIQRNLEKDGLITKNNEAVTEALASQLSDPNDAKMYELLKKMHSAYIKSLNPLGHLAPQWTKAWPMVIAQMADKPVFQEIVKEACNSMTRNFNDALYTKERITRTLKILLDNLRDDSNKRPLIEKWINELQTLQPESTEVN